LPVVRLLRVGGAEDAGAVVANMTVRLLAVLAEVVSAKAYGLHDVLLRLALREVSLDRATNDVGNRPVLHFSPPLQLRVKRRRDADAQPNRLLCSVRHSISIHHHAPVSSKRKGLVDAVSPIGNNRQRPERRITQRSRRLAGRAHRNERTSTAELRPHTGKGKHMKPYHETDEPTPDEPTPEPEPEGDEPEE
jgi:hypothetical protein